MTLERPSFEKIVSALSQAAAFPRASGPVRCLQTHISAVFLVDNLAYKVKKPKALGFLDFSTLEARRHFCHEEVRLNRRLAPSVYQGVVPIVRDHGGIRVRETTVAPDETVDGDVVEWAVRMVRLPEDRTLASRLAGQGIGSDDIRRVAGRIARFHARSERGPKISESGDWPAVAANHRENFEQIRRFVGATISAPVLQRLRALSERELAACREMIRKRADDGVPVDTHGDLRLEHVYLLEPGDPGRSDADTGASARAGADDGIVIIDCVEFSERYRWADPVSDMAFLFMELQFEGQQGLAEAFQRAYFELAGDEAGRDLLPLYATYRDVVRGKVRSLQFVDATSSDAERDAARVRALHHFLAGLVRLADPGERPAIVVVLGLPGVGKSTVARALAASAGLEWIDTDRVRKRLPGTESGRGGADFERGLYDPERTEKTYASCLERARDVVFNGGRALVEGSFRRDRHRRQFVEAAAELGVPIVLLECRVDEDEARRRLGSRTRGPSDADWAVHRAMVDRWEQASDGVRPFVRRLSLEGTQAAAAGRAMGILAGEGLVDPE